MVAMETLSDEGEEAPVAASRQGRKILIYGMNFSPELAGVGRYTGEIAQHLADEGMDVTVVTTQPHYPGWRVQEGSRNRYSTGIEGGMRVRRVPLLLRQPMRGIWRLLAPLSFALTSAPIIIWEILRHRPPTVICVEPTLFAAPVAQLAAALVGAFTVLHVQDLEVDAAFAVGHLGSRISLKRFGFLFERATLLRFHRVVTISDRMAEKLAEKGVSRARLQVVRNWVDLGHIFPLRGKSPYRAELGFRDEDFVVLYSGNIGAKQGLDILLAAAERLKDRQDLHLVVAGEGPVKADLQKRYGHLPRLHFLPFQPYERLNAFLNLADLHALPQDRGAADLVLPSKLGGMLASGKPVLVTADAGTELATFVADAATIVPPGDVGVLADAIELAIAGRRRRDNAPQLEKVRCLSKDEGLSQFVDSLMP
ncbi:MAG: WcaI family glycosyltransferase [Neorhizobium sp.]|nr:WcaI family glycosyltransferase [Neorhizobium sp.]